MKKASILALILATRLSAAVVGSSSLASDSGTDLVIAAGSTGNRIKMGAIEAESSVNLIGNGFGHVFKVSGMENTVAVQNLSTTNETYSALSLLNPTGVPKATFGYGNYSTVIWNKRVYVEGWEGQALDGIVPDIIFVQTKETGGFANYPRLRMIGSNAGGPPGDIVFYKAAAWTGPNEPANSRALIVRADGSGVETPFSLITPILSPSGGTWLKLTGAVVGNDLVKIKNTEASGFTTIAFQNELGADKIIFGVGNSSTAAPFTNNGYIYLNTDFIVRSGSAGTVEKITASTGVHSFYSTDAGSITTAGGIILSKSIEGVEQGSSPTAPVPNGFKIYAKDVGGKTALFVRFATGAEQQIAVEPDRSRFSPHRQPG